MVLPTSMNAPKAMHRRRIDETTEIAVTLGFQPNEVFELAAIFRDSDADGNDVLDVDEFLARVKIASPFARRIFSIFDADGSAGLDFREFVVALYMFCSLSPEGVQDFAFRAFASPRKGAYEMRAPEKAYLLDVIYHPKYGAEQLMLGYGESSVGSEVRCGKRREALSKALNKLSDRAGGAITLDVWRGWVKKHPECSTPILFFQTKLRKACGGVDFWSWIAERRAARFRGADWLALERLLLEKHNFGGPGSDQRLHGHRAEERTLRVVEEELPRHYRRAAHQPRLHRAGKDPLPRIAQEDQDDASLGRARKKTKKEAKLEAMTAYCHRRAAYVLPDEATRKLFLPAAAAPKQKKLRTVHDRPGPRESFYA